MARRFLETGSLRPWLSHHIRCNRDILPPATSIRLVMAIRRRVKDIRRRPKDIRLRPRAIRRRLKAIRRRLRAILRKLKAIRRLILNRVIRRNILMRIRRNTRSLMDSRDTHLKAIPNLLMLHKGAIRPPVTHPQAILRQVILLPDRDTLHKLHIRLPDTQPLVPIPQGIRRPDIRLRSRDIGQTLPLRQFQPDRLLVTQMKI